jgi:hypothetical protein
MPLTVMEHEHILRYGHIQGGLYFDFCEPEIVARAEPDIQYKVHYRHVPTMSLL